MCQGSLHDLLKSLPKCEHHMHLEGALTPKLLFELASKNQIQLPADDKAFTSTETLLERYNHFTSLDDFLHYYYIGMNAVMHAEVFFDPQAHLERGVSHETVLAGFGQARKRAQLELGISSELVCCFLRHLPVTDSLAMFQTEAVQASFARGEIIGIGLDSSENGFPPELFTDIYSRAKMLGMRRTAHAGEEGPAAYIRASLDDLSVERIDHGIRLADDPALLARIAREGIMLTVCPMSNVLLRCVTQVSELPIRAFLDSTRTIRRISETTTFSTTTARCRMRSA
ncbi:hypothetical protein TI39_contig303g00001 [Zymoseptoria brevis]|uniref:Adenine deaminase n=1 Tax=Zymoseptoria brevis TaxID=1047168 RepID=A0A0F4GUN3_9PEZI|nr:hypothetical protein TI39_contig303g00001 [Zymoseptoria brevis]